MIQIVLVPTDFSEYSYQALKLALEICRKTGSRLIIINAYHPAAYTQSEVIYDETIHGYEQKANLHLEEMMKTFADLHLVEWSFLIKTGFVNEVIKDAVVEYEADLVVMGTKGATGLKEIILGSKTAELIDECIRPVIAVPLLSENFVLKHIVYAHDPDLPSIPGDLKIVADLAKAFSADIQVVKVNSPGEKEKNLEWQQELMSFFSGMEPVYKSIEGKDVEDSLRAYVESNKTDLLTLIHLRTGFLDRLFKRSISKKLTNHPHIPLLILNNKGEK